MRRTGKKSGLAAGRPAAVPGRDARELLLNAACQLFGEHGVAATTFAMIAQRAGLTPAMLHYYFTDREALIDAVVDERLAILIASVWDPVHPAAGAGETIRGIVERLLAGIEANPWVPSTWMREVLNDGGLLRSRVVRHLPFKKVRVVAKAIARGQRNGSIHPGLDPVPMVLSAIGLVMLHTATRQFYAQTFQRRVPDHEAICRHITSLLPGPEQKPPQARRKAPGKNEAGKK